MNVTYTPTSVSVNSSIITEIAFGIKLKREGYSTHPIYKTYQELYQKRLTSYWKIRYVSDGYQIITTASDMNLYNKDYTNWYDTKTVNEADTDPVIFSDDNVVYSTKYALGILIMGSNAYPQQLRLTNHFNDKALLDEFVESFNFWNNNRFTFYKSVDGMTFYRK